MGLEEGSWGMVAGSGLTSARVGVVAGWGLISTCVSCEVTDLVFWSMLSIGEGHRWKFSCLWVTTITNCGVVYTCWPCHHQRRKLFQIPMSLQRLGILSIWCSTDSLVLFCGVWGLFRLHILLLPVTVWEGVEDNCSHEFCIQYMVAVEWHGTHCEFTRFQVVSVDMSGGLRLLRSWMALLFLVKSSCGNSFSSS